MLIFIKGLTNINYSVEIELTDTVSMLKEKIQEGYNIPFDMQRIICCGKELLNNEIVGDYEVHKITCLHLVTKRAHNNQPDPLIAQEVAAI